VTLENIQQKIAATMDIGKLKKTKLNSVAIASK
jgi:hypothetical protein